MLGFCKFKNNNNKQLRNPPKITVEPGWREGGRRDGGVPAPRPAEDTTFGESIK